MLQIAEPVSLVVFDMAGTTLKDQKEVEGCFARACQEVGLQVSAERILALQGYSKIEVFRLLWAEKIPTSHPDFLKFVYYSYDQFKQILENHYHENAVLPTEGCLELFAFLRSKNIKIALTTGFYRAVADIILQKIGWLKGLNENRLNVSGLSPIDLSIASDEVERGRPEPDMILKAMATFGITDPQRVINIGDTPSDLLSGKKAGCQRSFGVTNGTHTHEQLQPYENDGLLKNLGELKTILMASI